MAEDKMMNWDDEIEDDGEEREFVVLEPGVYDFTVHAFERARYEAKEGGKAPTCNKAIITIKIAADAGDCYIKENFLIYKAMEWKISQFFRSIGMKKHGEKLRMNWEGAVGCSGKVQITKDKGNNDNVFFNHVKKFMDPVGGDDEWS